MKPNCVLVCGEDTNQSQQRTSYPHVFCTQNESGVSMRTLKALNGSEVRSP